MPSSVYSSNIDTSKSTAPLDKTQPVEKSHLDSWITSGKIGSKDAVLIFRTEALNDFDDIPMSSKTPSIGGSSTTSAIKATNSKSFHVINDYKEPGPPDTKKDKTYLKNNNNNANTANLNSTNKSNNKILTPLPYHANASESTSTIHSMKKSKTSTTLLNNQQQSQQQQQQQPQQQQQQQQQHQRNPPIGFMKCSPKKRLHNSLSSSASSISNEDVEFFDVKTTPSSENLNKHSDHPNKENIENEFQILDPIDMPAYQLQITYKFTNTETRLLRRIFKSHGLIEVENDQQFTLLWTGVHMRPDILRNLLPYQRVNHFPRSYELTRKDRLYKNIEKMQHLRGFKHFDIIPQSYVLPNEHRDLLTAHNKYRGPWIVKPAASSRGRGIFIVTNPDQIPTEEPCLVSKYIANPLCIDGHKCDIRVYVLVTSFDPLVIYIYEEGLVRIATVKYNRKMENFWNPCMHLCNYSINKYHSDYIKSADVLDEDVGHKWTLSALLRHLRSQGCDTNQLMSNIEDLIIKSLFACAQSVISACRMFVPSGNNCFELYGFDILIDDTLKPWLLEINLSPSLGIDSPLDTKVKASLMCNLLTLVGIPAFTPMMRAHYDQNWSRFKNVEYGRKTGSADLLNVGIPGAGGGSGTGIKKSTTVKSENSVLLTSEDLKILKNLKQQNTRRGGFVRVFPTEDSMAKYSIFFDNVTGIPLSTSMVGGPSPFSSTFPHNYNRMVYNYFYSKDAKDKSLQDNSFEQRMLQYERILETSKTILYKPRLKQPKSLEEGKKLRRRIRQLIENGSELTHLQSRQAFSHYLELVLRRLTEEPKSIHEKLILKFLNRVSGGKSAPLFMNSLNFKMTNKDRTAMVAKLLGDYLDSYVRETEAYIDPFDNYGMIPINLFKEFIKHADESDLESVLTLNTNSTHSMPFLYNRCTFNASYAPPIPTGPHGFLKALPSMIPSHNSRDNKIDQHYKSASPDESLADSKSSSTNTSTLSSASGGGSGGGGNISIGIGIGGRSSSVGVRHRDDSHTGIGNGSNYLTVSKSAVPFTKGLTSRLMLKDGNSNGHSPKVKNLVKSTSLINNNIKSPKRKTKNKR